MGVFDYAGAVNQPDAGGAGAPPLPPTRSLPSVGGPPALTAPTMPAAPAPAPAPPEEDPRLAAVLSMLQPKPEPPPWAAALQKIAPIIAGIIAIRHNAGGAFVQTSENLAKQQQDTADKKALEDQRLAGILHQQQMERHQANMETLAAKRIDAAAQKEQTDKNEKLLRDEWTSQSQAGGLIDTINDLIKTQGPEAADRYMASTHIGSLTAEGLPHTVKDLVDRYAVRAPDGTLIGGKSKTPKEAKAGTQEDWVTTAETIASKKYGRDLTDQERKDVDAAALKEYKNLAKDPDAAEQTAALKKVQLSIEQLRADQLRQQVDEMKDAKGEIMSGTKEFGIARDLAYGILSYGDFARMYAFQRSGREQMRKIYDKAREINPDFSPSLFEQGARFAGNPQVRRSLAAVANVESGVPSMLAASDAATRSNIKALNQHFIIPAGVQLGNTEYSDLQAAHKAFADELALALGVGTASDLKTKLGLDIADPSLSPEAFRSVMEKQVLPFLERRKQSLKGQMGPYSASGAQEMTPGGSPANASSPQPVPGLPGVTFTVR